MAITPEDLINKSFKIVRNESGYDRDEVDNYLDELVVELRALYTENESLKRKLAAAQSGSATPATNNTSSSSATAKSAAQDKTSTPAPVAAGGAQDAAGLLAMAQKLHDEYVSQGEKTRAELVAKGEKLKIWWQLHVLSVMRFFPSSPMSVTVWKSPWSPCVVLSRVTVRSCRNTSPLSLKS